MNNVPKLSGCTLIRNSLVTSVGCECIDDILGGGLPVSAIYLIDGPNARTYASTLLKYFVAEGKWFFRLVLDRLE